MDDCRRHQAEGYNHDTSRTPARWQNRKRHPGSWQPTIPSWEKKFCTSVGSIPWRKLLEAKKLMSFYKNVVQWNDSAGEEAFHNAKNRFWAKINGLPCDISLPDPNIYIDEIDWNCTIDPDLLLDFDREPVILNENEQDEKPVFVGDALFFLNQPIVPTGWGDVEEEDKDRIANNSSSGPCLGYCDRNADNSENSWELSCTQENIAMDDKKWGYPGGKFSAKETDNLKPKRDGDCWETWDCNGMNRESSGWGMSRYKTSRFHGDYNKKEGGYSNGERKMRVSFVYDRALVDKKPLPQREWNSFHYCGPISHHQSVETESPWNWKKPVI